MPRYEYDLDFLNEFVDDFNKYANNIINQIKFDQLTSSLNSLTNAANKYLDTVKKTEKAAEDKAENDKKLINVYKNNVDKLTPYTTVTSRIFGKNNAFNTYSNMILSDSQNAMSLLESISGISKNKKFTNFIGALQKSILYLSSAAIGGLTGYTLGKQNALLGIGGGMASVFP